MKYLKYISIFILTIVSESLIIFHFNNITAYNFRSFMEKLENKLISKEKEGEIDEKTKETIIEEFEKVFGHYYDNAQLGFAIVIIISFCVMFCTIIAMFISVIWQFCNKCFDFRVCCIIVPIYCLLNMLIYFGFASNSEYKVNVSEKYLNMYDDEFNKEIKNNLDFMYKRKITLFVCVFVAVFGIIAQLIITIKEK